MAEMNDIVKLAVDSYKGKTEKYSVEIENLTPPDLNAVIVNLESKIKEAKARATKDKKTSTQETTSKASTFSGLTLGDALRFAWMDATFAVERKVDEIHRNRVKQSKDADANSQQTKSLLQKKVRVGKYYGVRPKDAIQFWWADTKNALGIKTKKKQ